MAKEKEATAYLHPDDLPERIYEDSMRTDLENVIKMD